MDKLNTSAHGGMLHCAAKLAGVCQAELLHFKVQSFSYTFFKELPNTIEKYNGSIRFGFC